MSLRRSAYPPGSKPMSRIRSHPARNAVLTVRTNSGRRCDDRNAPFLSQTGITLE